MILWREHDKIWLNLKIKNIFQDRGRGGNIRNTISTLARREPGRNYYALKPSKIPKSKLKGFNSRENKENTENSH